MNAHTLCRAMVHRGEDRYLAVLEKEGIGKRLSRRIKMSSDSSISICIIICII